MPKSKENCAPLFPISVYSYFPKTVYCYFPITAVLNNNYSLVKKLAILGVNAELNANTGKTPLDLAYQNGYLLLIQFFNYEIYNIYENHGISYNEDLDDEEDWDEYDINDDFHYYNNPADDPSENPWIDVFGEGDEARDAYWNTE